MSERTSPISPRSPQIFADAERRSEELFAFEGVDALVQAWRDGLTPDPALTVSAWADRHRFLSPRASAEPGRYRTDRTPYMRATMDALSPGNAARRIVFMKAAQVGATEAGNNWIGYVIHHAPGPCLRSSRRWNWPSASRASASTR
jgi:Bacteriophage tail assembly protein